MRYEHHPLIYLRQCHLNTRRLSGLHSGTLNSARLSLYHGPDACNFRHSHMASRVLARCLNCSGHVIHVLPWLILEPGRRFSARNRQDIELGVLLVLRGPLEPGRDARSAALVMEVALRSLKIAQLLSSDRQLLLRGVRAHTECYVTLVLPSSKKWLCVQRVARAFKFLWLTSCDDLSSVPPSRNMSSSRGTETGTCKHRGHFQLFIHVYLATLDGTERNQTSSGLSSVTPGSTQGRPPIITHPTTLHQGLDASYSIANHGLTRPRYLA
ncbi:hypothetical protein C8Q70DRAFT_173086 [Cubamyces menziesii]|nr:hypothetical protein C8Q70DRAFT_173086 [Cubamyces menziesii]